MQGHTGKHQGSQEAEAATEKHRQELLWWVLMARVSEAGKQAQDGLV